MPDYTCWVFPIAAVSDRSNTGYAAGHFTRHDLGMRASSLLSLISLSAATPACGDNLPGAQVDHPACQNDFSISCTAYQRINERVLAVRSSFYVFRDQDSALNHGVPSGVFSSSSRNLQTIHIDPGCVDDPAATDGCSADPDKLDRQRGTVLQIRFDKQFPGDFVGLNFEEPVNYGAMKRGAGFDLRGATELVFDVRAPRPVGIQIVIGGGCATPFFTASATWAEMHVRLNTLPCALDLSDVHQPFGVITNDDHAAGGGTILFDNVRFEPVPTQQRTALGLPLGNDTFGVVPRRNAPIPSDQVLRNLATTYETAMTELVLLARGEPADLLGATLIADALDVALHHDNHGDPLPTAPDGSTGLHNGYSGGELSLRNDQVAPGAGRSGDARLAGFSAAELCGQSGFCVLLDGATGGNNAFAILALVAAFERLGDPRYLNDAETIGHWITNTLVDRSATGYGGYVVGYPDGTGSPKTLLTAKSVENNADIFAAFTALARVTDRRGDTDGARAWTDAANVAGDFVMQMYQPPSGRFFAGTVPLGTAPGPGVCPDGAVLGNDQINTCDFLDENSFAVLAMAGTPRYHEQIDWRLPIAYSLRRFEALVHASDQIFDGFGLAPSESEGGGVTWEFTAQMIVALRYLDAIYLQEELEPLADHYLAQLHLAQVAAPFTDGAGLVASTLAAGDILRPIDQCLVTPSQEVTCIPERVSLAATTWAIAAEKSQNPFTVMLGP